MFRGAAIIFVLSILLTTLASSESTRAVHAQAGPQHVFSGYVSLNRQPLNDGFLRVTVGPGYGLQPPVQEVAYQDIRQGRYKITVEDPTRGNYSNVMLQFNVTYQGREYQRDRQVRLEPGRVTELNFDIEGWRWHGAQPQPAGNPPRNDGDMTANQEARLEMERERMAREDELRREEDAERRKLERERMDREEARQLEREARESELRREEDSERRKMEEEMRREQMEMERERMARDTEMREKEGAARLEMERERMEREEEMRREQMEMDRQRMGRGQPGFQPVAGENPNNSPKSGPSRGLFSNRKAGEMTSGVDNIMDPAKLTIIGIVLTVLTTGMTLFKGN